MGGDFYVPDALMATCVAVKAKGAGGTARCRVQIRSLVSVMMNTATRVWCPRNQAPCSPRKEGGSFGSRQRGVDPVCLGARPLKTEDGSVSGIRLFLARAFNNHDLLGCCAVSFMPRAVQTKLWTCCHVAMLPCLQRILGKMAWDGSQDRNLSEYRWGL